MDASRWVRWETNVPPVFGKGMPVGMGMIAPVRLDCKRHPLRVSFFLLL